MRHGRRVKSSSDWTSNVCNVGKHTRANAARNLANAFKVERSRIRRRATHKQLWTMRLGELLQFVVIDLLRLSRHAVIGDFVTKPRKIERMTMREVSAMRQIHSQ